MQRFLIALALAGTVDAVSYMVVAPSIVFYVLDNGGTKEQYGLILSAFSFASFCTKPLLGWWSDVRGFRAPYISSLAVATLGGLLYLLASALPPGRSAVVTILLSRLLGGVGAANSALGFAYIARVVPHEGQTSTNTLLSAVRMTGLAAGPGVNALIGWVDVEIWGGRWRLDPLNSVGLVLIATNLFAMALVWALLEEPYGGDLSKEGVDGSETEDAERGEGVGTDSMKEEPLSYTRDDFLKAALSADILVPFLSIFTFNANFQLIETGFPPAAHDGVGWGPVQTSIALGSMSVVIVFMMVTVSYLSSKIKVSDPALLTFGHGMSTLAYLALYLLWKRGARAWHFWLPVILSSACFPFMGAPTRSIFTVSVDRKPALEKYQGRMQAYLSMGASVAGFLTPGLVARYCLRTTDEVEASRDERELTAWSLFAPFLSLLTLVGMAYIQTKGLLQRKVKEEEEEGEEGVSMTPASAERTKQIEEEEKAATEASALLAHRRGSRRCSELRLSLNKYDPKIAVHRSSACACMGLTQGTSIHGEE